MYREAMMPLFLRMTMAATMFHAGIASAAIFAEFSPVRPERFLVGSPADPDSLNSTFLLDHSLITGV